MSLYDGLGLDSKEKIQRDQKSDIMGWSSGIKLLQSQLQLKKAALTQRDNVRKGNNAVLAPVVDLKSRRDDQEEMPPPPIISYGQKDTNKNNSNSSLLGGDWDVRQEYDPMWPNDYEKIMRDRAERDKRSRDREREREKDRDRDRDRDLDRDREEDKPNRRGGDGRDRYNRRDRYERPPRELERNRDDEFEEERHSRRAPNPGAAIAPPPSLLESPDRKDSPSTPPAAFSSGGSVAARIMAKYGFKEGQGLGKKEQGMSQALQVEKTSKRGGKIIHEKDLAKEKRKEREIHGGVAEIEESSPPSPPLPPPPPPPPPPSLPSMHSPPSSGSQVDSITEIMKNPSKVVLLRNMVGPGEVDEELEPETKEECGKYGDVIRCIIFEIPGGNVPDEDAVRIFIEFKRLESAIKAVVDLNGRYFGGRVVKASFYNTDKFKRLELA